MIVIEVMIIVNEKVVMIIMFITRSALLILNEEVLMIIMWIIRSTMLILKSTTRSGTLRK